MGENIRRTPVRRRIARAAAARTKVCRNSFSRIRYLTAGGAKRLGEIPRAEVSIPAICSLLFRHAERSEESSEQRHSPEILRCAQNDRWQNDRWQNDRWQNDRWQNDRWQNDRWQNDRWQNDRWQNDRWPSLFATKINSFLLRKVPCRLSLRESSEELALLSRSERRQSSQHRFLQQKQIKMVCKIILVLLFPYHYSDVHYSFSTLHFELDERLNHCISDSLINSRID